MIPVQTFTPSSSGKTEPPSPLGDWCSWIRDVKSKLAAQRDLYQYLHQTSVSLRRGLHNRLTGLCHRANAFNEP